LALCWNTDRATIGSRQSILNTDFELIILALGTDRTTAALEHENYENIELEQPLALDNQS
jgi:hypothetical protein